MDVCGTVATLHWGPEPVWLKVVWNLYTVTACCNRCKHLDINQYDAYLFGSFLAFTALSPICDPLQIGISQLCNRKHWGWKHNSNLIAPWDTVKSLLRRSPPSVALDSVKHGNRHFRSRAEDDSFFFSPNLCWKSLVVTADFLLREVSVWTSAGSTELWFCITWKTLTTNLLQLCS